MRALGIAATGMLAQQRNVEVVSNNLANMNTTGFMRRRSEFQDLLYQNLRRVGSTSSENGEVVPTGVQIGLGVKLAGVYRIHAQQPVRHRQSVRPRHPGPGILSDRDAQRGDRLYP